MLTPAQAAATLHVSLRTLRRWTKDGDVTVHHTPTGQPRYFRADVLAALTRQN